MAIGLGWLAVQGYGLTQGKTRPQRIERGHVRRR